MKEYLKYLSGLVFILPLNVLAAPDNCCSTELRSGDWLVLGIFAAIGALILGIKIENIRQKKQMFKYWEDLSIKGLPDIKFEMSTRCSGQKDKKTKVSKRKKYATEALAGGSVRAKIYDAIEILEEEGSRQEALTILQTIDDKDYPIVDLYLGQVYIGLTDETSENEKNDIDYFDKALFHLEKAASGGISAASVELVYFLTQGFRYNYKLSGDMKLSTEDAEKVILHAKKVISEGNWYVSQYLGLLYEHEYLGKKDKVLAYMYYQISLFGRNKSVFHHIKKLEKKMSFLEIKEAKEKASIELNNYYKKNEIIEAEEPRFNYSD